VVVGDVRNAFIGVRFQVAVGAVGVAGAATVGVEAVHSLTCRTKEQFKRLTGFEVEAVHSLTCRGAVGDGGQAVGAGGVGIGQIVNLAVVAGAAVVLFFIFFNDSLWNGIRQRRNRSHL